MACACNKRRAATAAGGAPAVAGTYRVMVNGRQVYETSSKAGADTVAQRFTERVVDVRILSPGETA